MIASFAEGALAGKWIIRGLRVLVVLVIVMLGTATAVLWLQARRTPEGRPDYVALGSSFAAGAGLGKLEKGSPLLCARSLDGYPQQLARMRGLSIVDMSCGGAVTKHLVRGGQFMQGPQVRVIDATTRLVTITAGGNDIGYVGDLSMLAARNSDTVFGWLVRPFWKGPRVERDYAKLERELAETLDAIRRRAPGATVVVATYPTLLPATGTCARIGLTEAEADRMRAVGDRLAEVTRTTAARAGAVVVDMHVLGTAHDACSAEPWTNGWTEVNGAPFHPTRLGAKATAEAISQAIDRLRSAPAAY